MSGNPLTPANKQQLKGVSKFLSNGLHTKRYSYMVTLKPVFVFTSAALGIFFFENTVYWR